jgi:hypothetical protein
VHRRWIFIGFEIVFWTTVLIDYKRRSLNIEYIILLALIFGLSTVIGYFIWIKRTAPGLYENGVQHPDGYFIPYREIGHVEIRERAGGLVGSVLRLTPRQKGGTWDWDYYEIPTDFLGPFGLKTIRDKIGS